MSRIESLVLLGIALQSLLNCSGIDPKLLQKDQLTDKCPTRICKCNRKLRKANCSGRGKKVNQIPELPRFVQTVQLDSDYFPWLDRTVLQPIVRNNVTSLSLQSSQMQWIRNDTFQDLIYLESLNFGSNVKLDVLSLKEGLASIQKTEINLLEFEHMRWNSSHLSAGIFSELSNHSINWLKLADNSITNVPNNAFKGLEHLENLDLNKNNLPHCTEAFLGLRNLQELHLKHNEINTCDITFLPKTLTKLVLTSNWMIHIPNFCLGDKSPLLPALRTLHLENNFISRLQRTSFICLPFLAYLNLNFNNIRKFPSRVFFPLKHLEDLFISQMKLPVISIKKEAFSVPSLTRFIFRRNRLRIQTLVDARRASLSNCSALKHLDLSSNYLPKWPRETQAFLAGLTQLKTLLLIDVKWTAVPDGFFHMFPDLQKVDLSSNSLASLNHSLFPEKSNIKSLILTSNAITHVGPETFWPEFWNSVQRIDLSDNPFVCNCKLLWFRDKVAKLKRKFKRYPKWYQCLSPKERKGLSLARFNLTAEECEEMTYVAAILVSTGSFVVFGLIVVLVVHKCRWHIRYWVYLLRYKRRDQTWTQEMEFKYDAFVIYSDEDSEFVHGVLLEKLENEQDYKMCIHFRDFEVGRIIVDNIVTCMSESRQAIVIVSKYFCESRWCKFELLLAHDRWLRNESDALVIVMLEEVDSRHMTRELRALIKTTTYCKWTGNDVGQELFWEQLLGALKKES